MKSKRSRIVRLVFLCIALLLLAAGAIAEHLPLKQYTVADGLPRDHISRIVCDKSGYMWFCTPEGLARFDGYNFTTYSAEQGIDGRQIFDFIQTHDGTYWVATESGIARYVPNGKTIHFTMFYPDRRGHFPVLKFLESRDNTLWIASSFGVYRCDIVEGEPQFTKLSFVEPGDQDDYKVRAIVEDKDSNIWCAATSGLYRLQPNGHVDKYPLSKIPVAYDLLYDQRTSLWAATGSGLFKIDPKTVSVVESYDKKHKLPDNFLHSLLQVPNGDVWIASSGGATLLSTGSDGKETLTTYTSDNGLPENSIDSLGRDRNGNIWLGTDSHGAMRLASNGFRSYSDADGLAKGGITAFFKDTTGDTCVLTNARYVNRFDGTRFHATKVPFPKGFNVTWGWNQYSLQARDGEWWIGTGNGLLRFAKMPAAALATATPKNVYTSKNGLPTDEVFRLYEDSHGNIWISSLGNSEATLTEWVRATDTFRQFHPKDGMERAAPTAFREDSSGNLWIGLYSGGLLRYTNGKFYREPADSGAPTGFISNIYFDHLNRIWVGTDNEGAAFSGDPLAQHPKFVTYSRANGLSSNQAACIVEDKFGKIYLGTGRGVDRLDPATGQIQNYTTADGLAGTYIYSSTADRDGNLWFGSLTGLSRLTPVAEGPSVAPPVSITALRVSGISYPVADIGVPSVKIPDLNPNQNDLNIDFAGLSLAPGESLRYEYRLAGTSGPWSPPSSQRSVNYPNLSPGSYTFLVRAVSASGVASEKPASVSFTILPPVWQQWWFIAGVALLIGIGAYFADRYRVARLVELERVRTRIATDLHDDIGASLSRMAILSEVVKQDSDGKSSHMLTEIADSARGLVDSMSDIVWSIDPSKDDLTHLLMRVRAFASDVLEPQNIHWELLAPSGLEKVRLSPDQRRHIYLIFKEAINNIARHSGASRVQMNVAFADHGLQIDVSDNGCGLKEPVGAPATLGGNGLKNMAMRVAELGGTLAADTPAGGGTQLRFNVRLK